MKKTEGKTPIAVDKLSFEEALEELEELTQSMAQGDMTLKSSVEGYKRGVELVKRCREELKEAQQTIQTLESTLNEETITEKKSSADDLPF